MPSPRKPLGPVAVPPNATSWSLVQLYKDENGRPRRKTMKTPPLESGVVPEQWSTDGLEKLGDLEATVLAWWGPGEYRVDFQDAKGQRVPDSGRVFEVAKPTSSAALGKRKKKPLEPDDDDDLPAGRVRAMASLGGGSAPSFIDYLAVQRQEQKDQREREERLAERAEVRASQQRESDRQFFTTLVGLMKGGGGGGADADLVRREISLQVREGMLGIRRDLATDLGVRTPAPEDDNDDDDDRDRPKDIGEAGSRIVLSMLGELEQRAPEMLTEAIPTIVAWMRSKGMMPSPQLQAQIDEHRAAQNGRGGPHA